MAVTFVGDVHGWSARLDAVLSQAEGHIVLVGDLVDRGPDTPGVLGRVRALVEAGRASCLLGNHEYALLRALGEPGIGLSATPGWFELWRDRHGGHSVLASYGVNDAQALRRAMGAELLAWLAKLPWYLQGEGWLAVHAGMRPDQPLAAQLELLRHGWRHLRDEPDHLYDKLHVRQVPDDMPPGTVLVSGHLPLPNPVVTPRRILCDTSGGLPNRRLTGVVWPAGRIITSA